MAETVYSGSVEPDQVKTCEGNKQLICYFFLLFMSNLIQQTLKLMLKHTV